MVAHIAYFSFKEVFLRENRFRADFFGSGKNETYGDCFFILTRPETGSFTAKFFVKIYNKNLF